MKVTFIQPYYPNIWEPLAIGYISSYLKKEHPHVQIRSFQGYFDCEDEIIDAGSESDIIAFSTTTPTFGNGIKLAAAIKTRNPKVHCVFGGWHVSAVKEITSPWIDQIVIGEGEKAFSDIVSGNRAPVIVGERLSFSNLPWPDRAIIRNERTIALAKSMTGLRMTSFQANRVCPFQCSYCAERTITGDFNKMSNPIRTRDISDLCDELEFTIKEYQLEYFKFVDATFDTSADFVISFCKEKIRRGIQTPWECLIHTAFMTEEVCGWLSEARCCQIDVGVESGSPAVLRQIRKGSSPEAVRRVFRWARKFGIRRRAFLIIGMPGETIEDLKMTEKLVEEIDPDVFGVTILCPYPGTRHYEWDKFSEVDWSRADEYSNDFWQTPQFSNSDLKKIQQGLLYKFQDKLCYRQKIGLGL